MSVAVGTSGSAQTNSLSITVNVGDLVAVVVNNADNTQPTNIVDNGGNFYGLVAKNTDATRGFVCLYVCNGAKFSATSISFDAGHTPSIQAITFTGASGIGGVLVNANSTSSTNAQCSTSTKLTNDFACTMMSFFKSGTAVTVSTLAGTIQTSQASTTTVPGGAIVTTATTSVGAYNAGVNFSAASSVIAWGFEVWAATYNAKLGQNKKSTGSSQAGWGLTR